MWHKILKCLVWLSFRILHQGYSHLPRSLKMTSLPRISYDILTFVIDQLASEGSYDELVACSQTCQMLLHPCRVHIFSDVAIDDNNAPEFVALLKNNSTIAQYIQELTSNDLDYSFDVGSEDLANTFLFLNNVKKLNFIGGSWKTLPPYIQHAFTHLLSSPSMSSFSIEYVRDFPVTLLSSCSTLKHLSISGCHLVLSKACDNISRAPPQLLSLRLSYEYPELTIAKGDLTMFDFSSLRSLSANVIDKWQEKNFEDILRLTPKLDDLTCSGIIEHLFEYPSY
jgi:hypothetical protein